MHPSLKIGHFLTEPQYHYRTHIHIVAPNKISDSSQISLLGPEGFLTIGLLNLASTD